MPATARPTHSHSHAGGQAGTKPKLYNRHHPERTLLYQTIAEHFETWHELASAGQFDGQGDHHSGDGNRADPAFQGFGRVTVGADGAWRFRTIRPVPYTGRTPHIHFKVKLGARELLTTQLYEEGDAGNARDGRWHRLSAEDRAAVTVPFVPGSDGLQARFPIVVAA